MKNLVVQISGKQGSGKSSLADSLQKKLERDNILVVQHSYARVLYQMHSSVLAIMSRYKNVPAKDGRLLQVLGTDWGREVYGSNVWVDIVRKEIEHVNALQASQATLAFSHAPLGLVHLISDCRFPNEASAFTFTIRLDCPEPVRRERILATPGQSWREKPHESETALDNYEDFHSRFRTDLMSVEEITNLVSNDIHHCLAENGL